jgi:hypothetical protein
VVKSVFFTYNRWKIEKNILFLIPQEGYSESEIEWQTTQWSKEKGQNNRQISTKHTHKAKDQVTRTPLKNGMNSGAPEGHAVPATLVVPVVLI